MAIKKIKTDTTTESKQPQQIFDVARPGTLPPADATARPVIVTNRVVMQDPMMVPKDTSEMKAIDDSAATAVSSSPKLVIKPLDEQKDQKDVDSDGVVDKDSLSKPAQEPEESVKSPEPAVQTPAEKPPTDDDEQAAATTPESEKNEIDKQAAELEADAKAQDEIDTLVAEKTYFLPINTVGHRRSRNVLISGIILILLLALVWLNIALDAGLITIPGVKPLTHLFSN